MSGSPSTTVRAGIARRLPVWPGPLPLGANALQAARQVAQSRIVIAVLYPLGLEQDLEGTGRGPSPILEQGILGKTNTCEAIAVKPTDRPIASPEVVLREEFDDWAVLFQPLTGEAIGMGPVGVAIWKILSDRRTVAEVAAEIEAQCEDPPDTVLKDTLAFVDDLQRRLFLDLEGEG